MRNRRGRRYIGIATVQEHSRPVHYRRGRPQRRAALRAAPPTPVSASTSSTARDRRPQARASSAPTAASIAAAKAAAHEHAFKLKLELVRAPHEPRRAGVPARRGLGSSAADASVARAVLSWAPEWRRRGRSDDAHGLGRAGVMPAGWAAHAAAIAAAAAAQAAVVAGANSKARDVQRQSVSH